MLRRFGLTSSEALSFLRNLSGMSMPFIMFPTAIINALSVLLLPTVSEAQAMDNEALIGKTSSISIKYSLLIGILSTGIFLLLGEVLEILYLIAKKQVITLVILAWLCPLIYLTTTLGSIINGLGKTHITFINSIVVGTLCKIFLIIILIPQKGITGYLAVLLIGQLIITSMDTIYIIRNIPFSFDAIN